MKKTVLTAPQISDCEALYGVWKQTHVGTFGAFVRFMTAPTRERADFIASQKVSYNFSGQVAIVSIEPKC